MVSSNIRFFVLEVPASENPRFRSSDRLVPEADPYIAGLIRKLQAEVRAERAAKFQSRGKVSPAAASVSTAARAEAPPPLGESPIDFESPIRDDDWPLLREFDNEE